MGLTLISRLFTNNLSKTGDVLIGNTSDSMTATYTIELDQALDLNPRVQVFLKGNTFILTSGTWADLIGAFIGANIDFVLGGTSVTTTVVFVEGAKMEVASVDGYTEGDYSTGSFEITDMPEAFEFYFNLCQNSVGGQKFSFIDGETQRYEAKLVNALTPGGGNDLLVQLGFKSGGSFTGEAFIKQTALVNGKKRFDITYPFIIWSNLFGDLFKADDSIGDYVEFHFRPQFRNPAFLISTTSFRKGNVGFENESFNGGANNYILTSIDWVDSDTTSPNAIDEFDYTQFCSFTAVITKESGSFSVANNRYGIRFFREPIESEDFQNKLPAYDENIVLKQNNVLVAESTPTNIPYSYGDSSDIKIDDFTVVDSGTFITVTGKITPSVAFTTELTDTDQANRDYKLQIVIDDNSLDYEDSDAILFKLVKGEMTKDFQPLGAWPDVSTFTLEDHNGTTLPSIGQIYLEDDSIFDVRFTLPKDTVSNPYLALKGRIVVVGQGLFSGERFTLEEFSYDISNLPAMSDGTLSINYTQNRGFKLPATSDKHDVTFQLFPSLDTGSDFGVQLLYPFITRYEDWLTVAQANNYFFGSKNADWFHYSDSSDWQLEFQFVIETPPALSSGLNPPVVSVNEYVNSFVLQVHNYDDWAETSAFTFFEMDGTTVITKPYDYKKCIIVATHTIAGTYSGSEWGIIHVRKQDENPNWMLSSVLDHSDSNNPLEPLAGELKAKLTIDGTNKILTLEAVFDPLKLPVANITLTTRVDDGGALKNIYKQDYLLSKKLIFPPWLDSGLPVIPDPQPPQEVRASAFNNCGEPFLTLASTTDDIRYKNDVNSAWSTGESVSFKIYKEDVLLATLPSIAFPNQLEAFYCTVEWRDYLMSDGIGCYTITFQETISGILQAEKTWGNYDLKEYLVGTYYNARYTARILSEFNDMNDAVGINFTDARVLDSLRLKGKFGYFNDNTEVDNIEYVNGRMEKIKREDFTDYELRIISHNICHINRLRFHILSENSCWLSSNNYDDFSYEYFDVPVIVKEGFIPDHTDGSRKVGGVVKFEDKIKKLRTHFQDNRQTAEALAPPTAPITIVEDITYNVNVNGVFQSSVTLPSNINHTININA